MDPTRFFGTQQDNGSAVSPGTSGGVGDQAQPAPPQVPAETPGQEQQFVPGGHLEQQQAPVDSQQQPDGSQPQTPPTPPVDPAEVEMLRRQNREFQQKFQQIQSFAEQQEALLVQQQIQQRYDQRVAAARATAENMSPKEAIDYLERQMRDINAEWMQNTQRLVTAMEQRMEQERRILGTPLWVQKLVRDANLPPDAEQELLALGDPAVIERFVPFVKKRYEQNQQLQQRLDQMARSMQAGQMMQAGAGVVGGTIAPAGALDDPDKYDDPDDKAMAIYRNIKRQAAMTAR